MANDDHIKLLKAGVEAWNAWRRENHSIWRIDLQEAYLSGADLTEVDLRGANLHRADLRKANLRKADLSGANLFKANLTQADLTQANLSGANLAGVDFIGAQLVETNLANANLTGCQIYGISAWNLTLEGTTQKDLIITREDEPVITVDDLKVAQFVYLLLDNKNIRDIIDTITSKAVLILGRFTDKRKPLLDTLREALRQRGFVPILFDFPPSERRDLTETIQLLANMAKFIIADITEAKSIPQELSHIIPLLPSVSVQPIILSSERAYAMYEYWPSFNSVLPEFAYEDEQHLIENLDAKVIQPVNTWQRGRDKVSVLEEKSKELEARLAQKEQQRA
jgi:uncharacterized protein YjbI with pentapeptide repeats